MSTELPMIGGDKPTFPSNCPNCHAPEVENKPGSYLCGATYSRDKDGRWVGSCPVDTGRAGEFLHIGTPGGSPVQTPTQTIGQQREKVVSLLSEPAPGQLPIADAIRQTIITAANSFADANQMTMIVPGKFFDFLTDEIAAMLKTGVVPQQK